MKIKACNLYSTNDKRDFPKTHSPLTSTPLFHPASLQAITHVDFSARVQSVSSRTNPKFHALLQAFKDLTGCGLLVNTSFNDRDEPIVCTPEDAYNCFMNTEIDDLVMGNYIFLLKNKS